MNVYPVRISNRGRWFTGCTTTVSTREKFVPRIRTRKSTWQKTAFRVVINSGLASRDHTLVGPLWEGRRYSRDTYSESYITKHTSVVFYLAVEVDREEPEGEARIVTHART